MKLEEFKALIQGKTFKSTDGGFEYRFIPENTLTVNGDMSKSVHYSITEEDSVFILNHNSMFGTEPLVIDIISTNPPVTFGLSKQHSKEFEGTWKEVLKNLP